MFEFLSGKMSPKEIFKKIEAGEKVEKDWFRDWETNELRCKEFTQVETRRGILHQPKENFTGVIQVVDNLVKTGDAQGIEIVKEYLPITSWEYIRGLSLASDSKTWSAIANAIGDSTDKAHSLYLLTSYQAYAMSTEEKLNLKHHTPAGLINLIDEKTAPKILSLLNDTEKEAFYEEAQTELASPQISEKRKEDISKVLSIVKPLIEKEDKELSPIPKSIEQEELSLPNFPNETTVPVETEAEEK